MEGIVNQVKLPNPQSNIEWTLTKAIDVIEDTQLYEVAENRSWVIQIEAWAVIVLTKAYRTLQGSYGRSVAVYISDGYIDENGVINWEEFE